MVSTAASRIITTKFYRNCFWHQAVVWSVDVWKDLGGGRWDSNYDLFYRVLDTNSGQFLTQEVRLTDDFSSDYVEIHFG